MTNFDSFANTYLLLGSFLQKIHSPVEVVLVSCLDIWWHYEIWIPEKWKFDYLKNEKSFWSKTKTFFHVSQVFSFRNTKQTSKNVVNKTFHIGNSQVTFLPRNKDFDLRLIFRIFSVSINVKMLLKYGTLHAESVARRKWHVYKKLDKILHNLREAFCFLALRGIF